MATCSVCGGEGYQRSLDDHEVADGIMDPCYHCETTGEVNEETSFRDSLFGIASDLAAMAVQAMIVSYNTDPEGEGWGFRAADCGMSEEEYTKCVMWDTETLFFTRLEAMTREEQSFMLAMHDPYSWHALRLQAEYDAKRDARCLASTGIKAHRDFTEKYQDEADIPF